MAEPIPWHKDESKPPIEPWTIWQGLSEQWSCRTCGSLARDGLHDASCKESALFVKPKGKKK